MSGSPLRWPTKQVCIKCPFTQDLSSSPTGLYIYIYIYILKIGKNYTFIPTSLFRDCSLFGGF